MKPLGINLTPVYRTYMLKNYKVLVKEIKDLNEWRNIPRLWIGRINISKMLILPRIYLQIQSIVNKLILKFIWKDKRIRIARTVVQKSRLRELSDCRTGMVLAKWISRTRGESRKVLFFNQAFITQYCILLHSILQFFLYSIQYCILHGHIHGQLISY